jgi:hypothetical protein
MTKHIAGFILFSFIVGFSGVLAFIFAEIPKVEIAEEESYVPRYESKTRCFKRSYGNYENSNASVKVVQAVFNERTKLLDTNLFIKREDSSIQNVTFALHFFVKDGKGASYLASENYYLKPDFNSQGEASQAIPSRSYQWMDDLTSQENLYVIADTTINKTNYRKDPPDFDENKATAIISLKGK